MEGAQGLQAALDFYPAFFVGREAALGFCTVEHPGVDVVAEFEGLVEALGGGHGPRTEDLVAIDFFLQRLQHIWFRSDAHGGKCYSVGVGVQARAWSEGVGSGHAGGSG